jgi:hypothetical protein
LARCPEEAHVAANASEFLRELRIHAFTRILAVIERVVDQGVKDGGDHRVIARVADGPRDVVRIVLPVSVAVIALVVINVDVANLELITGRDGEILGDRETKRDPASGCLVIVGPGIAFLVFAAEHVHAGRDAPAKEIRVGEAEFIGPRSGAAADCQPQAVAAAKEVAFRSARHRR